MHCSYTDPGTTPAPAIQLQRVTKRHGAQVVLSELNLEVFEGEFLGLVGVNGAGKTTLIKCLLDLDTLTSGEIVIFNRKHSLVSARERLAYLPEKFFPPYYLTGWDFLRYMSQLHGNDFNPDKICSLLRLLDLETSALDKPAARLSKGTAQKLGLTGCLLSGKKLLVMDEPMSGLDPRARVYLQRCLLRLKRQGYTCLFSTHLLADMEKLCDRMAILHQGKIRYVGSPEACCRYFNTPDLELAFLHCIEGGEQVTGYREQITGGGNGEYIDN